MKFTCAIMDLLIPDDYLHKPHVTELLIETFLWVDGKLTHLQTKLMGLVLSEVALMKRRLWGIVGGLLSIGLFSGPAFAASVPAGFGSSYYGGTSWSSGMPYNLGAYDYANTPSVTTGGGAFGLWEGTNNSSTLSIGVFVGYTNGGGGALYTWADNRPNGGVNFHQPGGGPAIGTSHAYEIQYLGGNEWGVYVDFQQIGTSISNPPGSYSAFAGAGDDLILNETMTFSNQTNQSLEYLSNGSWDYWWGGSLVQQGHFTARYTNSFDNEEESE